MDRLDRVWDSLPFDAPWKSEQEKRAARRALERFLVWHEGRSDGRAFAAAEHAFETSLTDRRSSRTAARRDRPNRARHRGPRLPSRLQDLRHPQVQDGSRPRSAARRLSASSRVRRIHPVANKPNGRGPRHPRRGQRCRFTHATTSRTPRRKRRRNRRPSRVGLSARQKRRGWPHSPRPAGPQRATGSGMGHHARRRSSAARPRRALPRIRRGKRVRHLPAEEGLPEAARRPGAPS